MEPVENWALFDRQGRRKYLVSSERKRFFHAAMEGPLADSVFANLLLHSGCRISEALAVCPQHIDVEEQFVVFRTLKKRGRIHIRAVPVPRDFWKRALLMVGRDNTSSAEPIWRWSRSTAWRKVKRIMARAGIEGVHASPKGLRHGFAVEALAKGAPLTLVKTWLGHSRLESTQVYTQVMGAEERAYAERMWW